MPAVVVEELWQGYRRLVSKWGFPKRGPFVWALQDVSLSMDSGEMLGVVGHNGSGKTTLLKSIAGVFAPFRGQVSAHGRIVPLLELTAGSHRELTGRENLLIGGVLLGLSRGEIKRASDDIVAFSGLTGAELDAPLRTYSAGMGLRLAVALAVHARPDVFLLDEVLAVADEEFHDRCLERLTFLKRDGCAVIVVSQDMSLICAHCDRAAVLVEGRLDQIGQPGEVVTRYHDLHGSAPGHHPGSSRLFAAGRRGR